eukprot:CAMPEP_0173168756 /NCGR_PEP_ID=MMETSP1141-20130122/326_1 /TAXON_ID=483371 /ORGANISM="non described non described, Strain CCMP2298" /LENGTH=125 /DNA_ID=CAMNT_0014090509 /DNA_START=293 /DNA_END=671 /DNA_ORIENTATION=+
MSAYVFSRSITPAKAPSTPSARVAPPPVAQQRAPVVGQALQFDHLHAAGRKAHQQVIFGGAGVADRCGEGLVHHLLSVGLVPPFYYGCPPADLGENPRERPRPLATPPAVEQRATRPVLLRQLCL